VLPLVCRKIAGSVPTGTSLQVLESERATTARAEECPHLVEGRCPHAGTCRNGERSTHSERMRILFRGDTEDKFALKSSHPRRSGGFGSHALFRVEGNTRNRRGKQNARERLHSARMEAIAGITGSLELVDSELPCPIV